MQIWSASRHALATNRTCISISVSRSYIIENTQYINTALIRGVLSFRPTHVTQKKRLSTDFFCGR